MVASVLLLVACAGVDVTFPPTAVPTSPSHSPVPTAPPATPSPSLVVQEAGLRWAYQFGSQEQDAVNGVAADGSAIYLVGEVAGVLAAQTGLGPYDAFIRKYDSGGNELWTRQFGTKGHDVASDVAVDASGVYVIGGTDGAFPGQTNAGRFDAFVRKYDADGNVLWTRQFGTTGDDGPAAVAADASGVYVAGELEAVINDHGDGYLIEPDAFVRKYDPQGTLLWERGIESKGFSSASDVAVDASGVYIVASTSSTDLVRKYDLDGGDLWTRQFESEWRARSVAIPDGGGGVYVTGSIPWDASAAAPSAFMRKYDATGTALWTRQWVNEVEDAPDADADASGVFVAGYSTAAVPGHPNESSPYPYVRMYDPDGGELWTLRLEATHGVDVNDVSVDASAVYVVGTITGSLPGQASAGEYDAFVLKLEL